MILQIVCILLFLSILLLNLDNSHDIIVTVLNGSIRGRLEYSLRHNVTFYAFQQIPYGKPPIGTLRFKDPEPAAPWKGILDATKNDKICYQTNSGSFTGENEDCLFLNVYTPHHPSVNVSYPVIVYIHGGSFLLGSSTFDAYGPHYFMEHEIIIVTVNYRLGPFGFLSTGNEIVPGNQGLKDQTLGLQWVRDNIEYFGGDPKKITIMGQSAGAASVTYHLMSPKSQNLFRAAIANSGSMLCAWTYQANAVSKAYQLAKTIDASFNSNATSEELIAFLRSATAEEINNAAKGFQQTIDNYQMVQGVFWAPVIEHEHEDAFITESMYLALEEGRLSRVPLLIGINSEEALGAGISPLFMTFLKYFDENLKALVNKNMNVKDNETLEIIGEKIRKIYTNGLLQDSVPAGIRYYSDMSFTRSIIRHAHMQSMFSDVYFYEFSYDGQLGGEKTYFEGAERVTHAEEGNYLWVSSNNSNLESYSDQDVLTSDRFRILLTNFAKYLNPTPEPSEILENLIWPKVNSSDFKYLNINTSLILQTDPKNTSYPLWVDLYNKYTQKPLNTY